MAAQHILSKKKIYTDAYKQRPGLMAGSKAACFYTSKGMTFERAVTAGGNMGVVSAPTTLSPIEPFSHKTPRVGGISAFLNISLLSCKACVPPKVVKDR